MFTKGERYEFSFFFILLFVYFFIFSYLRIVKVNIYDRQILQIALPAIVTNITVPLLGLVDTAIVGHMGDAAYMGGIAVGSMIFNLVYWIFGFLRMGTSGMTAQAFGANDWAQTRLLLKRSLQVSAGIALMILLLQWPLRELMLWLMEPSAEVRPLVVTYFSIVVWGAPAMLGLYGLTGWFIGMQNTRIPMIVSILQNLVNILMSLLLVYGFGMKMEGVALGTLIAQWTGFLLAVGLVKRGHHHENGDGAVNPSSENGDDSHTPSFFRTNRDIFLRTLCLVAVNLCFTSLGARQGTVILAVNALLMQFLLLFSYILDGFAYAGEALGGRYWGAKDDIAFRTVVRRLFGWGVAMTIAFTSFYIISGMGFLRLLTDEPNVVLASREYVWWAWLIPVCGVTAFIWDGIFIGITHTKGMLLSAFLAAIVFSIAVYVLMPLWGNHGLWLALLAFLTVRGIVQTALYQYDKSSTKGKTC